MGTIKNQGNMSSISFKAKLFKIGSWTIIKLPKNVSTKLPSRGMTLVNGTINGSKFQVVLDPDGKGSHWFRVDEAMQRNAGVKAGDSVTITIKPSNEWPEPELPVDLKNALMTFPKANTLWMDITPMARWDWIRWIGSTKQQETRMRRIEVACSKLSAGERRPCCFNRTLCTEPYVSKNGILLDPTQ